MLGNESRAKAGYQGAAEKFSDTCTATCTTEDKPRPNKYQVTLERTTLRTSRLLDFCSRKELIAQTGHQPAAVRQVEAFPEKFPYRCRHVSA